MAGEPQAQPRAGAVWFVQAGDKVWGPYPETRIEAFVAEGRVAAETLVAPEAGGPFRPAGRQTGLHRLFGDAVLDEAPASRPERASPEGLAEARPLLVWASLRSQRPERFEALLGSFGAFVRVGPGLWLVRARVGPSALRNAMTRRLDSSDSLMVVDAPQDQAAWFNIDGETDRMLRQLWGVKAEG